MPDKKVKRKIDYKNLAIVIGIVIALILVIFVGFKMFNKNDDNKPSTPIVQNSKDTYPIRSNATDYQKELNDELKAALKSESYLKIAESVAQNFIADFFTLSNKTLKNDVGGAQYWQDIARINFREKAIDTYYRNLELYLKDYDAKDLPTVSNVKVLGSEEPGTNEEGNPIYFIEVEWEFSPNSNFSTKDFQTGAYIECELVNNTVYIYNFYQN